MQIQTQGEDKYKFLKTQIEDTREGGGLKREDLKSRGKMCGVSISVSLCLRDVPLMKRGGERSLVEMWGVSVCPLLCLDWYVGMGP